MGLKQVELTATKLYKMFKSKNQLYLVFEQPPEKHVTFTEYMLRLTKPMSTFVIRKFAYYIFKCL